MTKENEIKVLKEHEGEILRALAEAGMSEMSTSPYSYNVPNTLSFDCGGAFEMPIRGHYALLELAKAAYADAKFCFTDDEGFPTEDGKTFTMKITDPYAMKIDAAIAEYQNELLRTRKAYVMNGRFYKVA